MKNKSLVLLLVMCIMVIVCASALATNSDIWATYDTFYISVAQNAGKYIDEDIGTMNLNYAYGFDKDDENGRFIFEVVDYSGSGTVTYTIVDEQGDIVQTKANQPIYSGWTSSQLSAGIYYVYISNNSTDRVEIEWIIYY